MMGHHKIDLHELANTPGAGIAQRTLRSHGLWDPAKAAVEGQKMVFKVRVSGTYIPEVEERIVEVIAESKEDAENLAFDLTDFDEFEGATILEVREVEE